ncbi:hypothetical protein JYU34_015422 [Plutella xylostella]|uniref:Uncharacterized protein n=1 Tax=Plutella xylostella TaxID=51655 RepID=A0ABQ7Q744_PLUXY|nr:hypothetical protein JYU34_015422 [Plutella xylostella]
MGKTTPRMTPRRPSPTTTPEGASPTSRRRIKMVRKQRRELTMTRTGATLSTSPREGLSMSMMIELPQVEKSQPTPQPLKRRWRRRNQVLERRRSAAARRAPPILRISGATTSITRMNRCRSPETS